MNALFLWTCLAVAAFAGIVEAQSAVGTNTRHGSEREQLAGAWRLAWMEEQGRTERFIASTIGRVRWCVRGRPYVGAGDVPKPETDPSNVYAKDGYEASFGSYDVNESTHTLTYPVEGALVRTLIGKIFVRVYRFSEGRLIIRSARPDEHWSVIWEHC